MDTTICDLLKCPLLPIFVSLDKGIPVLVSSLQRNTVYIAVNLAVKSQIRNYTYNTEINQIY